MSWHKGICGIILLLLLFSCKKEKVSIPITTNARRALTLDSIYLYAKQIYFWNDALPEYQTFDPQQYKTTATPIADYSKEVLAISQLKLNPNTGLPYEKGALNNIAKYSYINSANTVTGNLAAVALNETGNDYGLTFAEYGTDDIRVAMVNPGSPADVAGIVRGNQVITVNGVALHTGTNTLNDALVVSTMQLGLQKANGQAISLNLRSSGYSSSPVLKDTVFTTGGFKTGYLALARFSALSQMQTALTSCIQNFEKENIISLIIDLRYNGGGYVESAEYLADLIAPASLQSKVSYTEHYNELMQQGNATILKNQPYTDSNGKTVYANGKMATYADIDYSVNANTHLFNKIGGPQYIKQLYFIVSANTASASELIINIFKPYLNVKLIGSTTYGKPVGFFPVSVDSYKLYLTNFQVKNSTGNGDYFNGIPADYDVYDDVTRNFGEPQEACLAKALGLINCTTQTRQVTNNSITQLRKVQSAIKITGDKNFGRMIETRFKLKKY
jgi:carboxyl-terminal processing protease